MNNKTNKNMKYEIWNMNNNKRLHWIKWKLGKQFKHWILNYCYLLIFIYFQNGINFIWKCFTFFIVRRWVLFIYSNETVLRCCVLHQHQHHCHRSLSLYCSSQIQFRMFDDTKIEDRKAKRRWKWRKTKENEEKIYFYHIAIATILWWCQLLSTSVFRNVSMFLQKSFAKKMNFRHTQLYGSH